jgi:outer membrane immunogenic protein
MRNKLISGLAGVAFILFASGSAFAATPKKKTPPLPPPPSAPVYSWTGWYVGGNVGYSWGAARTDITGNATTFSVPCCGDQGLPSSFAFAYSKTTHLNGVIGGGQFGFNLQVSPQWVLGVEADIQGSGERGSSTFVDPFSGQICIGRLSSGACIAGAMAPVIGTAMPPSGGLSGLRPQSEGRTDGKNPS